MRHTFSESLSCSFCRFSNHYLYDLVKAHSSNKTPEDFFVVEIVAQIHQNSTIWFAVSTYQSTDFSIYEKGLDVISKMHYCQTEIKRWREEENHISENLE